TWDVLILQHEHGITDTWDVLILQHEHGITDALAIIDDLRAALSSSIRNSDASEELLDSLQRDLELLPEISPRYKRLNAEEPYRLKATCVRQKLLNTRTRLAELLADLHLIQESLRAHRGQYLHLIQESLRAHRGQLIADG
ncbi:phosphoenolpyruvate carboxylase, partial [Streptomyces sp. MCAF7]